MEVEVIVDYSLYFTYAIFCIALLLTILFPLIQMAGNLKKAIKAIAGVAAFALAFTLCYVAATGEEWSRGDAYASAELMRIVEAALYLAYVMFAGTFLTIIVTSFSRYIK